MSHPRLIHLLAAASTALVPLAASAQHEEHKHPEPARSAQPHEHGEAPASPSERAPERPSDPYALSTCPVSGKKLGEMGDPVVKLYEGREVRFCCDGCIDAFEAAAGDYWKKIDEEIVKQQTPYYPLTTCIMSGEPLTEDGEDIGISYVYRNRLVRLCCRGCIKDFLKDPEATLKKLDATAIQQQRTHYPLTECVVSGEALGSMGDPYEVVIGGRLVRLCCNSCEKQLRAAPLDFLPKLDEAWKRQGMPRATDKAPAAKPDADDDGAHKHDHGEK